MSLFAGERPLSRFHPAGRFKARVLARAGFREPDWKALIAELRRIAAHGITVPGLGDSPWPEVRRLGYSEAR
jgi:hypothetical protein